MITAIWCAIVLVCVTAIYAWMYISWTKGNITQSANARTNEEERVFLIELRDLLSKYNANLEVMAPGYNQFEPSLDVNLENSYIEFDSKWVDSETIDSILMGNRWKGASDGY